MFDGLQPPLIVGALVADAVARAAAASRIPEFDFAPNRVAALGQNLLRLAHPETGNGGFQFSGLAVPSAAGSVFTGRQSEI